MEMVLIEEFEALDIQEDVRSHSLRVMELSVQVAKQMISSGYEEEINVNALRVAALYHDVGKMDVSKFILNKPGKLCDHELKKMQQHVKYSGKYASERGFPSNIIKIILHHHENCSGTGYPFGLTGSHLSIESKILRAADIYDALTSDRPYRKAFSQNDTLDIILKDHKEYDMNVLRTLLEVLGVNNIEKERIA